MIPDLNARRGFLKAASAGLVGGKLMGLPETLDARNIGQGSVALPVTHFGAKRDGKALDTPPSNHAIDAAARAGGGIVFFPAGTYLCYSIHLKKPRYASASVPQLPRTTWFEEPGDPKSPISTASNCQPTSSRLSLFSSKWRISSFLEASRGRIRN